MALDVLAPGTRAYESHLGTRGRGALGRVSEGGGEDTILDHGYHALVPSRFLAEVPWVAHGAALFASFVVVLTAAPVAPSLSGGTLDRSLSVLGWMRLCPTLIDCGGLMKMMKTLEWLCRCWNLSYQNPTVDHSCWNCFLIL